MFKKFFILTRGRTGSTAIMDELHKCDNISATQELFLQWAFSSKSDDTKEMFDIIWPFVLWKEECQPKNLVTRVFHSDRHLANLYLAQAESRSRTNGSLGFGFKVLRNNLDEWPFLLRLLKRRDYQVIYLSRNTSDQVLSGMIANKSGIWNTKKNGFKLGQYQIDPKEFQKNVIWEHNQVQLDLSLLASLDLTYFQVTYEEFCNNREMFFEKIFSYLEIPTQLPPTSDYKVILKNASDIIQNYNELTQIAEELGIPFVR